MWTVTTSWANLHGRKVFGSEDDARAYAKKFDKRMVGVTVEQEAHPAPETINGLPILRASFTPAASATRPGHVVLVEARRGEYVTAWLGNGDTSWCWGHYFTSFFEAERDYLERCKRGY